MIVTDLEYSLEKLLVQKLQIMVKRCIQTKPKKDALLINEGAEGEGKTNSAVAEAYFVKYHLKNDYGQEREINLFFKLEQLIKFAKSTKDQIIIWDEPALDALGSDQMKELNKNLLKLLMVVRMNRHFFIFNFTKFFMFKEYIVVDRGLGMVHMYSRNEIEPGRFVYIKKANLEPLYLAYRISKKRLYKKFYSFRGSFPEVLERYFDKMGITVEGIKNATYADYERLKRKAINSVGDAPKKDTKPVKDLKILKHKVSKLKFPIKNKKDFAKLMGITVRSLQLWAKNSENIDQNLENSGLEGEEANQLL